MEEGPRRPPPPEEHSASSSVPGADKLAADTVHKLGGLIRFHCPDCGEDFHFSRLDLLRHKQQHAREEGGR